jgi:hypothetical protein
MSLKPPAMGIAGSHERPDEATLGPWPPTLSGSYRMNGTVALAEARPR